MKLVFALVSAAIFISAPFAAKAQSSIQAELLACKAETDSLKRLVCYDKVAKKITPETLETQAKAVVPAQPKSIAEPKQVVAVAPTVVESAPKATATPTSPSKAEDTFGNEYKPDREEWLDEVKLEIAEAKLNSSKKWRVTFTNGQRWQAQETKSNVRFKAGDIVIIKRGAWSAFYMKKEGSNRKVRVKRL